MINAVSVLAESLIMVYARIPQLIPYEKPAPVSKSHSLLTILLAIDAAFSFLAANESNSVGRNLLSMLVTW